MKNVYRVLAYLIAAGVAFQASVIVFAVFGLFKYVDGGGSIDKASQESAQFPGVVGFGFHAVGGMAVIPLLALLLLISSFFAKIPGGIKWALVVLGVTVLQVAFGLFAHDLPALGLLHGVFALVLFGVAISAAMRVNRVVGRRASVDTESVATPVG